MRAARGVVWSNRCAGEGAVVVKSRMSEAPSSDKPGRKTICSARRRCAYSEAKAASPERDFLRVHLHSSWPFRPTRKLSSARLDAYHRKARGDRACPGLSALVPGCFTSCVKVALSRIASSSV
jgi:hypothetical protein